MEIRHAIRTNGSVREFRDEPVSRDIVAEILDDARFAPSGGNRQPWRVTAVEEPTLRRSLADLMQPVWDEYMASQRDGVVPYNSVDYPTPAEIDHAPNLLLDRIESVPAVLVVAADLRKIVAMDKDLRRAAIVPGASVYPFCWNAMLSARAHGLGGVMTTFLARTETAAAELLRLPEHHAIAAVLFLGYPVHQPTKLRRGPVDGFASIDTFDGPALG
jgi:nitroreductase